MPQKRPLIGVGVFVLHPKHPGKILLGRRKGSHGAGQWSVPGGHFEMWESFDDVCKREVEEETGLTMISFAKKIDFTNDRFIEDKKHYVTLFFSSWFKGKATNKEPDRCHGWRWFSPYRTPENLFPPLMGMFMNKEMIRKILQIR